MEKPHRYQCAAKLLNAKPLRPAAFRQNRQSKYVLEHILRPSIHTHSVMARHAPVRYGKWRRPGETTRRCAES
jgi:hypothetical protein